MLRLAKAILSWQFLTAALLSSTLLTSALLFSSKSAADNLSPPIEEGQAIYLKGTQADGGEITAVSQQVAMSADIFACVNCHRHSGLGTSEGGFIVPAITGSVLFAPIELRQEFYGHRTKGFYTRPAYTRETLRKAITEGISASGAPLDKVMPRYQLSQQQTDELINYLETLDYSQPPGISDEDIQIATIITEGTPPAKKQALLVTLEQYFKEKNAQTRHEVRRVKFSPWHKNWHYDYYRQWKLNVWELKGPPESWPEQLEDYYRANPVFTVIGGTSHLDWSPIHRFCETTKVPCLFPDTDLPDTLSDNHFNLYLSAGMTLEANRVIQFLQDNPEYTEVIQIVANSRRGKEAARLLAEKTPQQIPVTTLSPADFHRQATTTTSKNNARQLFIFWLESDEMALKPAELKYLSDRSVVFSSTLLDENFDQIPNKLRSAAWLIHPYSLPNTPRRMIRSKTWLHARKIETPYSRLQANTYLAVNMLIEGLMHIRSNFSREYMIERIEHMIENTPATSVYPRLSLAPGQRYASKGSYLIPLNKIQLPPEDARQYWAVPEL